jgi:hypothetical protein
VAATRDVADVAVVGAYQGDSQDGGLTDEEALANIREVFGEAAADASAGDAA